MDSLAHNPTPGNPCPDSCPICDDVSARHLAARLGMVPADADHHDVSMVDLSAFSVADPDDDDNAPDDIDAHAAAAGSIRWGQWNPLFKRPTDGDYLGELARDWGPPSEGDEAWWAEENIEGCGIDELSPEEEAMEILSEPAWERACREHAEEMEAMAQEALYHELVSRLGGFSAEF